MSRFWRVLGGLGVGGLLGCTGLSPVDLSEVPLLPPGASVAGESGAYSFTPQALMWRRVAPGTVSDEEADLELIAGTPVDAIWIVVHVQPRTDVDLDDVVSARREQVAGMWDLARHEERRSFYNDGGFLPVSHARYASRGGSKVASEALTVMTLSTDPSVIEVVGYAPTASSLAAELRNVMASFRLRGHEIPVSKVQATTGSNADATSTTRLEVEADVELRCDGGVLERLERRFYDASGDGLRSSLGGLPEEERLRLAEEEFRGLIGRNVRPKLRFEGLTDAGAPVVIRSEASYPPRRLARELREVVEPDSWLTHYARDYASGDPGAPHRRKGLRLTSEIRYALCPELEATLLGADLDFRSRFGTLTRRYEYTGDAVRVTTQLEFIRSGLAAPELEEREHFLTRALEHANIWFRMTPRAE